MIKYKITVDEPWRYQGPQGGNFIYGNIIEMMSSQMLLFESDDLLHFDNQEGKTLVLKIRYTGYMFDESNNYEGIINGGLLLINDYQGKSAEYLEENSKFFFIGDIAVYKEFDESLLGIITSLGNTSRS